MEKEKEYEYILYHWTSDTQKPHIYTNNSSTNPKLIACDESSHKS